RESVFKSTIGKALNLVHVPFRRVEQRFPGYLRYLRHGYWRPGYLREVEILKFTVQYLDSPDATVRYTSDLEAENAASADVSARIGFRGAQDTHGACCYRVLDDAGAVVATGPDMSHAIKFCGRAAGDVVDANALDLASLGDQDPLKH